MKTGAMQSERSPLLGAEIGDIHSAPPPPYSEVQDDLNTMGETSGTSVSGGKFIRCEVCSYSIETKIKKNKKVITCPRCQESTALGPPENGKRFLRCPECNCLLIVRVGVAKSICPRDRCKTTIDVKTGKPLRNIRPTVPNSGFEDIQRTPQYRIVCGPCNGTFVQETAPANNKIRCPLCQKQSHIGQSAARRTGIIFILSGMALVVACTILIAITGTQRHNTGYWYLYIILLVSSTLLTTRGVFCLCTKHSRLELAPTLA